MSSSQVPEGYKQTEVGVIPEDWEAKILGEILKIGNGFSFKGDFFSPSGPIVLTPGNFKLEGGLYFNDRNTKRYSGDFPEWTIFKKGDLLVVMTDLTPDCNLLGKPAFIDSDEIILHNQRIGKVNLLSKDIDKRFLYFLLLSSTYLNKIKEQVTGSTVRHTSNKSIYCVALPIPQKIEEQRSLAQALSDVDALIASLDKLIAKQRQLKTAAMQQLLTGKMRLPGFGEGKGYKQTEIGVIPKDWSVDKIGSLTSISTGSRNTQDRINDGQYPFFVRSQTVEKINSYSFDGEAILTAGDGVGTGKIFHYINGKFDIHQRVYKISNFESELNGFFFYTYFSSRFYDRIMSMTAKSSVDSVRMEMIAEMMIPLPLYEEQHAIATVLSDMDTAIAALETRRAKTQAIKQGMMQELLTGRTRLV